MSKNMLINLRSLVIYMKREICIVVKLLLGHQNDSTHGELQKKKN